jgi:hypothetical protein
MCRTICLTEQTYYRWKKEYGGLRMDRAKRLKELEKENTRLKHFLADAELDKATLRHLTCAQNVHDLCTSAVRGERKENAKSFFQNGLARQSCTTRNCKRRGQDCPNLCSLHFAVCSNDWLHNNLSQSATVSHLTQNFEFYKPQRYKSATNFS